MPDPEQLNRYQTERRKMVERQIAGRGVRSRRVLEAMARVPREEFIPERLWEFAYDDTPLPIDQNQTISQPYIVALMVEALEIDDNAKVLDVGTGSGYATAVLAEIAETVYTIERLPGLAEQAKAVLEHLAYDNVEVIVGDGSGGWAEAAPYDAILVSAGGPDIPQSLRRQLAVGGKLVIPVGQAGAQTLKCVTRVGEDEFREDVICRVQFVPLVGDEGWPEAGKGNPTGSVRKPADTPGPKPRSDKDKSTGELIAEAAEAIDGPEPDNLDGLLQRIGNARVVLLGESSHGTSEFYRFRARLTRELIEKKGFNAVAVEADWPDAARIDHYVRELSTPPSEWRAFTRFPVWMWRNTEFQEFVEWLRRHNAMVPLDRRAAFYGLDLYSLFTSIDEVLKYLDKVDPEAARVARERYGCLTPWQRDPATYGRAAVSGRYRECRKEVVDMLTELLDNRLDYMAGDDEEFFDAVQNARLVANAEEYYRCMYDGYADSWNLRDSHMFETLRSLLDYKGKKSKIVVWEHNSHIGDARATDMTLRGEHNLGQLCRQGLSGDCHLVGFGTHAGTVAAADNWGDEMQVMTVRPALEDTWEHLCHESGVDNFILDLGSPDSRELYRRLRQQEHERAIGVIYRPASEWISHYFQARLGEQFDDYVWFDRTRAVTPLDTRQMKAMPDTYPFGI